MTSLLFRKYRNKTGVRTGTYYERNNNFFAISKFEVKDDIHMIAISRSERDAILAKYPNTHIVRTMRQDSKRKHYFCTESPKVMKLLNAMRSAGVIEVRK